MELLYCSKNYEIGRTVTEPIAVIIAVRFLSLTQALAASLTKARRLTADQGGTTAVITAIALVILMGFCGLAVDAVMWEVSQRAMQGTADQAALAAATAYRNAGATSALGDSATAKNAAYATAIRSGYPVSAITIAAYNNGGSCTNHGCLKVTLTQQQRRYFTAIFLHQAVIVSVSAVGTCTGCGSGSLTVGSTGGQPCVMALDGNGRGVVTTTGGAVLSLNECNLYNNAPQTDATVVSNNSAIEGCSATNICGSEAFLAQPNNPGGIDVPVVTGSAPAPDPYAGLTAPTVSAPCQTSFGSNPVPSGTYCPGTINDVNVSFQSGATIVIEGNGGLQTRGNSTISCTGCTLYVLGGGSVNANSTINISAPQTGAYAGVAVWFGDSNAVSWAGGNGAGFSGAIYAPKSDVSYSGNQASTSTCTRLIGASVTLAGSSAAAFDNGGCPIVAGPALTASGVSGSTPYTGSPTLSQ